MPNRDTEWEKLRSVGDSTTLPALIHQMLDDSEEAAYRASQEIERNVCPGRELYEAAEAVTLTLASLIRSGVCSVAALDLLVEIAYGEPSSVEQIEGNDGLALRCAALIKNVLPTVYELARLSDDERFRQGAVDLATRLETSEEARRNLLSEFRRDDHGVLLDRALDDLEKHLSSQTLVPDPLLGNSVSVAELLQGGSEWKFWRAFGVDLGGRTDRVGLSMQFRRGVEETAIRIVCEKVNKVRIQGLLILGDGHLRMCGEPGQYRIEIEQGDFQLEVQCAAVVVVDPWELATVKECWTGESHD
ncbi:hypothetical protein [Arachnia propionica]|uniref:Uncharacterized protein n=1 Tax=Arachnia propionica TaxID=1750 RepID=A0A3P1WQ05_9ACTN|nr:hypothetical protein [Arachnia propionica]RRD48674.1 hypothetical protein EII35_11865 [Arachnia propionica]